MVELGKRVKFSSATALVQQLQYAKLQLQLPSALTKLDRFDLLIVEDVGYVKKTEAETSVLFELITHRYERRSLLITANQPFSQWDSIFSDSMMTVTANPNQIVPLKLSHPTCSASPTHPQPFALDE